MTTYSVTDIQNNEYFNIFSSQPVFFFMKAHGHFDLNLMPNIEICTFY
jgi:hypothetical protein